MQHHLRHEQQERRQLVGHALRGVEVPGVERYQLLTLYAVGYVEIVGTDRVTFKADAEDLRLHAVLHMGVFRGEYPVEGLFEQLTVLHTVDGDVLTAVVHPKVHDARIVLTFSHLLGNGPATFGVLHPEVADALVGIGQRQVAALGVREGGGVEVELHAVLGSPLHPALEVARFHLVAVDKLPAEVAVYLVQAQAVLAGYVRRGLQDVLAQLVYVAGLAGIVARGLYAAGERAARLEAGHVVGLPAMQGKGCALQGVHSLVRIDAQGGIAFLGQFVSVDNELFFHDV